MMERIMTCIPPNPRRVGYIDPIHGHLDGPLYIGSHIHQQNDCSSVTHISDIFNRMKQLPKGYVQN